MTVMTGLQRPVEIIGCIADHLPVEMDTPVGAIRHTPGNSARHTTCPSGNQFPAKGFRRGDIIVFKTRDLGSMMYVSGDLPDLAGIVLKLQLGILIGQFVAPFEFISVIHAMRFSDENRFGSYHTPYTTI